MHLATRGEEHDVGSQLRDDVGVNRRHYHLLLIRATTQPHQPPQPSTRTTGGGAVEHRSEFVDHEKAVVLPQSDKSADLPHVGLEPAQPGFREPEPLAAAALVAPGLQLGPVTAWVIPLGRVIPAEGSIPADDTSARCRSPEEAEDAGRNATLRGNPSESSSASAAACASAKQLPAASATTWAIETSFGHRGGEKRRSAWAMAFSVSDFPEPEPPTTAATCQRQLSPPSCCTCLGTEKHARVVYCLPTTRGGTSPSLDAWLMTSQASAKQKIQPES